LQELVLLLLELLLVVVGGPRGVATLALERLLFLAARVGGHERALLFHLVTELLEFLAPTVHVLLDRGALLLELLARRHAGGRARQHPLHVDVADLGCGPPFAPSPRSL